MHFTATNARERVVFHSVRLLEDGSIAGNDNDADARAYEPHYLRIDWPEQVQIYEPNSSSGHARPQSSKPTDRPMVFRRRDLCGLTRAALIGEGRMSPGLHGPCLPRGSARRLPGRSLPSSSRASSTAGRRLVVHTDAQRTSRVRAVIEALEARMAQVAAELSGSHEG